MRFDRKKFYQNAFFCGLLLSFAQIAAADPITLTAEPAQFLTPDNQKKDAEAEQYVLPFEYKSSERYLIYRGQIAIAPPDGFDLVQVRPTPVMSLIDQMTRKPIGAYTPGRFEVIIREQTGKGAKKGEKLVLQVKFSGCRPERCTDEKITSLSYVLPARPSFMAKVGAQAQTLFAKVKGWFGSRPKEGPVAELKWIDSLDKALGMAKAQSKPLLVDHWATWCDACKQLDEKTLKDPRVAAELNSRWLLARVDATNPDQKLDKYMTDNKIEALPTLVLKRHDSKAADVIKLEGFVSADDLLAALKKFP